MAFMSWEKNFFRKKNKFYLIPPFSSFCLFVTWFINEWSHNTSLVFKEGATEHVLGAKIWLSGFETVFWQN